jgi:hypothetical protein
VPIIKGNSLVLHFETDDGPPEWGYRLYVQPLDADERPCVSPLFVIESLPGLPAATVGKQDVTVHHDSPDTNNDGLLITFDRTFCSTQGAQSSRFGSRNSLKISSSGGKYSYHAGSSWKPLLLQRTQTFTVQTKFSSGTLPSTTPLPLDFRFLVEVSSGESQDELQSATDDAQGSFATDEAGEKGGVVGTSDCGFVCWLTTALCSPTNGLLHSCGASEETVSNVLKGIVVSCLRAVMSLPMSLKPAMLRALAIVVRRLDLRKCSFDRSALNAIRALREAAIAQHALEQPLVGSQRAQFSAYLQVGANFTCTGNVYVALHACH